MTAPHLTSFQRCSLRPRLLGGPPGRGLVRRPSGLTRVRLRRDDGQALLEFALILPIFLLGLFGITQFGLALNSANDQTHIANEVARYAAVNQNPGAPETLQAWAKKQATNKEEGKGSLCITFPNGASNVGDPVKVEFKSTIHWLPVGSLKGGANSSVTGSATTRLEQVPTVYSAERG